jgi:hypothetical protein
MLAESFLTCPNLLLSGLNKLDLARTQSKWNKNIDYFILLKAQISVRLQIFPFKIFVRD